MNDFTVKLGQITTGKNSFCFEVKDQFFEAFNFSDFEHANITAIATLTKHEPSARSYAFTYAPTSLLDTPSHFLQMQTESSIAPGKRAYGTKVFNKT